MTPGWGAKIAMLVACTATAAAFQAPSAVPGDVGAALTRIADRVESYYLHAQSIVCLETVRLQPLSPDLGFDGRARTLTYELRIAWDPPQDGKAPEARVVRQILKVNGRPPKPDDEDGCMDPKPVSPEPLEMLLPGNREDYRFTFAGTAKEGGRPALRLDYRSLVKGPAEVTWKDPCVSIELPGRSRGRVWVDSETNDVLRLDEQLVGMFEFPIPRKHQVAGGGPLYMAIERADSSIRYRRVAFHDPDETLLLPESIEALTIIRGSGVPRLRVVQTFSDYKRFLTGGRLVKPPQTGF